jgi:septal ring factor EnvC (AmiA/AmiB activator)
VILTNDNVVGLGEGATITLGAVAPAGRKKSKPSGGADNAERSRWQAAHHKQRQVIAALERRRSQLETEIDQIEDLGLTTKTMARLERAESKLRHLDEEIARERSALARIVRDARRRGAEPGWFR